MQGNRIRIARQAKKLTLREVGEAMDVTPQAVGQWEKTNPQFDDLKSYKLSNILGVSIDWLKGTIGSDDEIVPTGYASSHGGKVPVIHIEDALRFLPYSKVQNFEVEASFTVEPTVKIVGEAFAITIEPEDEMMLLRDGDVCIFDNGLSPAHGDVIVALVLHEERYHAIIAACYLEDVENIKLNAKKAAQNLPVLIGPPNSKSAAILESMRGYLLVGVLVEHRRLSKPWSLRLEKIQGSLVDTD